MIEAVIKATKTKGSFCILLFPYPRNSGCSLKSACSRSGFSGEGTIVVLRRLACLSMGDQSTVVSSHRALECLNKLLLPQKNNTTGV